PCPLAREIEAVARLHDLVSHGKKLMPNPTVVGLSLYANAPHGKFSTGLQSRAVRGPEESPTLHLHPDEDGTYAILSPDQTEWFSFNADASPSWRPNEPGQPGPWEKFRRDPDYPQRLVSVEFPPPPGGGSF